MKNIIKSLLVLLLSLSVSAAYAHDGDDHDDDHDHEEHAHGDVLLVDSGGQLLTGTYDVDEMEGEFPVDIFEAELELIPGAGVYAGDEPGFYALSQGNLDTVLGAGFTALPANTPITLGVVPVTLESVSSNLWRWNDVAGELDAVSDGSALRIESAPGGIDVIADGSDTIAGGALIGESSSTGFVHDHLNFFLEDGDLDLGTFAPEGVYVAALQYSDGQRVSDPFYLILGAVADEENHEMVEEMIESAEGFIESAVIPTPSSALLGGVGLLIAFARRSGGSRVNVRA